MPGTLSERCSPISYEITVERSEICYEFRTKLTRKAARLSVEFDSDVILVDNKVRDDVTSQ